MAKWQMAPAQAHTAHKMDAAQCTEDSLAKVLLHTSICTPISSIPRSMKAAMKEAGTVAQPRLS